MVRKLWLCSGCAAGSLKQVSRQLRHEPINKLLIAYDGQLAGHAEIARFALWLAMLRAGRARGPYAAGATVTTGLWSAKRGRARISRVRAARAAPIRQTPIAAPIHSLEVHNKLLVFDLGDARNARRGCWSLCICRRRRRVGQARLHL